MFIGGFESNRFKSYLSELLLCRLFFFFRGLSMGKRLGLLTVRVVNIFLFLSAKLLTFLCHTSA